MSTDVQCAGMKNGIEHVQTQIRMSSVLRARIEKYQKSVEKQTGLKVTFSTAVRALLEKGLEAAA